MRRHNRVFSAGMAALCGLAPAGTPAAASDASSAKVAEADATFHGRPVPDADAAHALAVAYWTPRRMRAATPIDMPRGRDVLAGEPADRPGRRGTPRAGAEPTGPLRDLAPPAPGSSAAEALAVSSSRGVGKVFFTDKRTGKDHQCSGATVNNPAANMVATAGHCVHPGGGGGKDAWYDNWIYVPHFHNGDRPHGTWTAEKFTSVEGWTKWGFLWWDFAFVTMHPLAGKELVHKTGGHGITFNQKRRIQVVLLGYPAKPPFDGQSQHYCKGKTKPAGVQRIKLTSCPLNEGASGGPFLKGYSNTSGFGAVNSVMSYKFSGNMYGRYFEEDVADIYNVAKNKT